MNSVQVEQQPLLLSPQQISLLLALERKDARLAKMYSGYLYVINQKGNPDRFSLAAHALRELQEKLPLYSDVPVKERNGSMKNKLIELEPTWNDVLDKSEAYKNSTDTQMIDKHIRRFLKAFDAFYKWFSEWHPKQRKAMSEFFRKIDPSGRPLPEVLEQRKFKTWMNINKFLEDVCHHRQDCAEEEFLEKIDLFEQFLLDLLIPKIFSDFDEIDQLIE